MFFPYLISPFYVIFSFSTPKSTYQTVRARISPSLSSPEKYCIVFSRVVYSRLKAFGGKHGKLKLTEN